MPLYHDNAFPQPANLAIDDDSLINEILSSKAAEFQRTATLAAGIPFPTDDRSNDAGDELDSFNDPFFSDQLSPTPAFSVVPFASGTPSSSSIASSSSQAVPTSSTPTSTSPSLSASATTSASLAASSQGPEETTSRRSGASSAAIGVTVTILLLLLGVAAFFLVRKKYIAKRQKKRTTWSINVPSPKGEHGGPRSPDLQDMEHGERKRAREDEFETIDIDEKRGPVALPDEITYQTVQVPKIKMPTPPPALHPAGLAPPRMPSPPPVMLTSPGGVDSPIPVGMGAPFVGHSGSPPLVPSTPFAAIPVPRSSVASSSVSSAMGAQITTGTLVFVARTFVPSLPDELSIQTGEQVRIISRFDDGWAHVERLRSGAGVENGVVPTECLEEVYPVASAAVPAPQPAVPGMGMTQEAVETWRLSKRKSSLNPAGPAHY